VRNKQQGSNKSPRGKTAYAPRTGVLDRHASYAAREGAVIGEHPLTIAHEKLVRHISKRVKIAISSRYIVMFWPETPVAPFGTTTMQVIIPVISADGWLTFVDLFGFQATLGKDGRIKYVLRLDHDLWLRPAPGATQRQLDPRDPANVPRNAGTRTFAKQNWVIRALVTWKQLIDTVDLPDLELPVQLELPKVCVGFPECPDAPKVDELSQYGREIFGDNGERMFDPDTGWHTKFLQPTDPLNTSGKWLVEAGIYKQLPEQPLFEYFDTRFIEYRSDSAQQAANDADSQESEESEESEESQDPRGLLYANGAPNWQPVPQILYMDVPRESLQHNVQNGGFAVELDLRYGAKPDINKQQLSTLFGIQL